MPENELWPRSASGRGLAMPDSFRSEEGEASLVMALLVGVVAADVVLGEVLSAEPLLDCCLPVIFLKEFLSSTLRSL